MAGLFEGSAPDPVELTKTSAAKAPEYLTNYLTSLSQAGMGALGTVTPGTPATETTPGTAPTVKPFTGQELIAELPDFYKTLMTPAANANLPELSDLTRYQGVLDQALATGKAAGRNIGLTYDAQGKPVFSDELRSFYDPYQQQVIDEMQKQSDINVQRNVLPALKALGVSGMGGALGSARTGSISGQALADIAANLQAQQTAARSKGFQTALDAALKQQQNLTGATTALSGLGSQEQQAATSGLKTLSDVGAAKLAYDQSKVEAPLKRALNVAEIMRGYTYPTSSTETAETIPTVMGPSPLSQIAGLGTLVGAAFPTGGQGVGNKIIDVIGNIFKGTETQYPEIAYPGDAPIIDRSGG
jgi:hypothetical protein